jgi:hypothetical protein
MRAGAGKGEARLISASTQGATSSAAGGRTTLILSTLPAASRSVSTIITPYSSGGSLPR